MNRANLKGEHQAPEKVGGHKASQVFRNIPPGSLIDMPGTTTHNCIVIGQQSRRPGEVRRHFAKAKKGWRWCVASRF